VAAKLASEFDLHLDVDEYFDATSSGDLTVDDFRKLLLNSASEKGA